MAKWLNSQESCGETLCRVDPTRTSAAYLAKAARHFESHLSCLLLGTQGTPARLERLVRECLCERTNVGPFYHLSEAEAGRFLSSRPAWSTKWVPGQQGLYKETLSQKTNPPQKTHLSAFCRLWINKSIRTFPTGFEEFVSSMLYGPNRDIYSWGKGLCSQTIVLTEFTEERPLLIIPAKCFHPNPYEQRARMSWLCPYKKRVVLLTFFLNPSLPVADIRGVICKPGSEPSPVAIILVPWTSSIHNYEQERLRPFHLSFIFLKSSLNWLWTVPTPTTANYLGSGIFPSQASSTDTGVAESHCLSQTWSNCRYMN
jgi:hypothetical protein